MNSSSRVQTSLTGLPAVAGEPGRLDGRFAGMLAAVAGPGVGHDDADGVIREPECPGELAAHAEGPLCSGPDGELAVFPLRDRRAGLERRMGDVGDGIGLLEADVAGVADPLGSNRSAGRSLRAALAAPGGPAVFRSSNRVLPEIGGPGFHSRLDRRQRRDGLGTRWARRRHEIAVVDDNDVRHRLGRAGVDRRQRRAERRGPQHFADATFPAA